MQSTAQALLGAWSELLGSLLIATGLIVATWTLGGKAVTARVRPQAPARALPGAMPQISPADQWERLVDIAVIGFARIETAAELHARAAEAVAAADDAVTRLLADCRRALLAPAGEAPFALPAGTAPQLESQRLAA